MAGISRREWLKGAGAALVAAPRRMGRGGCVGAGVAAGRPAVGSRHFTSAAVEALIPRVQQGIRRSGAGDDL